MATLLETVRKDVRRYLDGGPVWRRAGLWVTITHRLGALGARRPPGALRVAIRAAHAVLSAPWRITQHVYIASGASIGAGLRLPHPHGIFIPPGATIGEDCSIYHHVTLGTGSSPGTPQVGNHVTIYAGAFLLGGITIGDDVEIGPNAVVTRDIPAGSIVTAAPVRVIPSALSKQLQEQSVLDWSNVRRSGAQG